MGTTPIPLQQRIDLAEAFIELSWQRYKRIPAGRGWESERQAAALRAAEMAGIDAMLDQMLPWYDLRTLQAVS
jgi:hypothetical protein